jgi:hypothetical protein
MNTYQTKTFLPYLRGIPPEALRIGSLYLNPLEPSDGLASKRFEFRREYILTFRQHWSTYRTDSISIEDENDYETQLKGWIWKPEPDPKPKIEFEAVKGESMGLQITDLIAAKGGRNKDLMVRIEGKSARRLKLRE